MIARTFIILFAPPVLLVAFCHELWRGIRLAIWSAWYETMIELGDVKRSWRAKSLKPEGER